MMLDNFIVPTSELRVTMSMRIDNESLGSQSSGTSTANKGFKPKVFNISLLIKFIDDEQLTELIAIAQATDGKGALKIYDITDSLANALKVRRVQFCDEFYVREMDKLHAWNVQFSVQDYQSVPEKVEQRQEAAAPTAQTAEGATVENDEQAQTGEMSWFESQLAKADKALS